MINRFLLFMKMFLTGLFKFAVGAVAYLAVIIGVVVVAEIIGRFKILSILLFIILAGVAGKVKVLLCFLLERISGVDTREKEILEVYN